MGQWGWNDTRPKVSARRHWCQLYLLWGVSRGFTLQGTINDLLSLYEEEPDLYASIVPDGRLLAKQTLHGYWKLIPSDVRELARRRVWMPWEEPFWERERRSRIAAREQGGHSC